MPTQKPQSTLTPEEIEQEETEYASLLKSEQEAEAHEENQAEWRVDIDTQDMAEEEAALRAEEKDLETRWLKKGKKV